MSLSRRRVLKSLSVGLLLSGPLWARTALDERPCRSPAGNAGAQATPHRLCKAVHFEHDYADDVFIAAPLRRTLRAVVARLARLSDYGGYANFSVLSFDAALRYGGHCEAIGPFSPVEVELVEALFFADASGYGFAGQKPLTRLDEDVKRRQYARLPGSGRYLFKGPALDLFRRLQADVGDRLILTSGIRGIVKQMHLFLAKAHARRANLCRAARSVAPPGYSYHGIGDFDVGEQGLGGLNFTRRFADTQVYRHLRAGLFAHSISARQCRRSAFRAMAYQGGRH